MKVTLIIHVFSFLNTISHCILTFLDKPTVTLRMAPISPISELDRRNVTLFCDLVSGYPETLSRVNWYMDGNLLKELPDCPSDRNPYASHELCEDIDPRYGFK